MVDMNKGKKEEIEFNEDQFCELLSAVENINPKPHICHTTRVLLRDGEILTKTSNLTKYRISTLAKNFHENNFDEFFVDCSVAVFDYVLDYILNDKKEILPTHDVDMRAKVISTIKRLGLGDEGISIAEAVEIITISVKLPGGNFKQFSLPKSTTIKKLKEILSSLNGVSIERMDLRKEGSSDLVDSFGLD
jgi:hypothetical protein